MSAFIGILIKSVGGNVGGILKVLVEWVLLWT